MSRKKPTVSTRARLYATQVRLRGDPEVVSEIAWGAGYRAALRDVRKAHHLGDVEVHKLLNDYGSLK
jgi:hypothetical protein